jgi:hypothetical protein
MLKADDVMFIIIISWAKLATLHVDNHTYVSA